MDSKVDAGHIIPEAETVSQSIASIPILFNFSPTTQNKRTNGELIPPRWGIFRSVPGKRRLPPVYSVTAFL